MKFIDTDTVFLFIAGVCRICCLDRQLLKSCDRCVFRDRGREFNNVLGKVYRKMRENEV